MVSPGSFQLALEMALPNIKQSLGSFYSVRRKKILFLSHRSIGYPITIFSYISHFFVVARIWLKCIWCGKLSDFSWEWFRTDQIWSEYGKSINHNFSSYKRISEGNWILKRKKSTIEYWLDLKHVAQKVLKNNPIFKYTCSWNVLIWKNLVVIKGFRKEIGF